jgi:hypothetical protein
MKRVLAFVLVAAAIIAVGFVIALRPSIGPDIKAVSGQRLSQRGIRLLNPFPWDIPQISKAQAEQTAIQQGPGGPVLQTVLAEVIDTNPRLRPSRLCWVVSLPGSLIRSNGPPGSVPRSASFYLVFIDAHNGQFVEGVAGG